MTFVSHCWQLKVKNGLKLPNNSPYAYLMWSVWLWQLETKQRFFNKEIEREFKLLLVNEKKNSTILMIVNFYDCFIIIIIIIIMAFNNNCSLDRVKQFTSDNMKILGTAIYYTNTNTIVFSKSHVLSHCFFFFLHTINIWIYIVIQTFSYFFLKISFEYTDHTEYLLHLATLYLTYIYIYACVTLIPWI